MSYNKIASTSVIKNFKSLIKLDLKNTQIKSLDNFLNLINLEYLDLSFNKITVIGLIGQLTNLKHLDLGFNQIKTIDTISNLTNLKYLSLSNNQIISIESVFNLTYLTFLGLSNNQITSAESVFNVPIFFNPSTYNSFQIILATSASCETFAVVIYKFLFPGLGPYNAGFSAKTGVLYKQLANDDLIYFSNYASFTMPSYIVFKLSKDNYTCGKEIFYFIFFMF